MLRSELFNTHIRGEKYVAGRGNVRAGILCEDWTFFKPALDQGCGGRRKSGWGRGKKKLLCLFCVCFAQTEPLLGGEGSD